MTYSKKNTDQQHQKTTLPNGLTILSLTKKDISSVSIEVWIKVGSRYESSSLNGIAHFIEHLNFKGTKRRSAKQIAEEFDAIGGYLNAYTAKEHTVYTAKVLKEFLPFTIDILSDILFHSVYNEEEMTKEKEVILQELAQTKDNPDDLVFKHFSETSFTEQAVGRSILGSEENIKSFTKEQVINFVHKHYIAPRIIVSASGNLTHEELVELVKEKFIPFEEQETIEYEKALYNGGFKYETSNELSQLHIVIGYEGIPINSKDYYKLEMLSNIWGGSISSRLFQEIREKQGLVYSVESFCQYYHDCGIFGVYASTSSENAIRLVKTLSEEVGKITKDISKEEIERCLAQVKASLYMSRETADNWVSILASNYAYHGRHITQEEVWQGYTAITKQDLIEFALEIFSKNKTLTVTILGDTKTFPDYKEMQKLLTV